MAAAQCLLSSKGYGLFLAHVIALALALALALAHALAVAAVAVVVAVVFLHFDLLDAPE